MIGVDWGTSSLRAYRFAPDGSIACRRYTPRGILTVGPGGFPDTLRDFIGDWIRGGETRVVMCGMVGSRQGWKEAPYLPCPAGLDSVAAAAIGIAMLSISFVLLLAINLIQVWSRRRIGHV